MRIPTNLFSVLVDNFRCLHAVRDGAGSGATRIFVALAIVFALVTAPTRQVAGQTTVQLKANAAEAARAANEARQQAAEAAERLEIAQEAAAQTAAAVEAAERQAGALSDADRAAIEKVRREAERANRRADEALAAVDELQQRFAWDRSGAYIGVAVFWAPEAFNTDVRVDSSKGFSGWLGYRFVPRFAAELRADRLKDFDFSGSGFTGSLEAWELTANAKIFLLTKRFQPYVSIGLGAFVSQLKFVALETGERFSDKDTNILFRPGVGIDYYLTPSLVLGLEASYVSVGGDLDEVRFGLLGGGLSFRF
ncbi:MAG: porin family protein [Myxococcales bacterium]|nr:porin family protein [Myxococcales bacterium]